MRELARRLAGRWRTWRAGRKALREARRGFAYDRERFEAEAGALHGERKGALRTAIVMGYHVLEKGLTMPRRRMGFGQGAAVHLANLVEEWERRFGEGDGQVRHAVAVLRAYRELHRDWPEPMERLDRFLAGREGVAAAVEPRVTREAFYAAKDAPFPVFAASRHVVRHFAGPASREAIEAAVSVATTAPSACNRQPARVHAVADKGLMERLFALQGGTRGFGGDAGQALVVTVDLSSVRWGWERHDAWTNGGMFAMNLCHALHWHGVAHCILHWSVPPEADREARRLLGIPENEAIVLLLACGQAPEAFEVAASPRVGMEEVLAWHG